MHTQTQLAIEGIAPSRLHTCRGFRLIHGLRSDRYLHFNLFPPDEWRDPILCLPGCPQPSDVGADEEAIQTLLVDDGPLPLPLQPHTAHFPSQNTTESSHGMLQAFIAPGSDAME